MLVTFGSNQHPHAVNQNLDAGDYEREETMNDRVSISTDAQISEVSGFRYDASAVRIIFGQGTRAGLADEFDALDARRIVVVSTPEQAASAHDIASVLGNRVMTALPNAIMHTPEHVTEKALEIVRRVRADAILAIGGGSAIGLSKALSIRSGIPQVVLPTTYAGSEVTPVLGETKDGLKVTRSNPAMRPRTVIYDVDLTLTLPANMSCSSGINAMAHAVEALYAVDANPITSLMAEQAVASLAAALPGIVDDPSAIAPRSTALYGAWLAGTCLGTVGMALHHKLCHVLGGSFGLPHAQMHAVVLPHALAFNGPCAPSAIRSLQRALDTDDPAFEIYELEGRLGLVRSLRELGMAEHDLELAADIAVANPYKNPRNFDRAEILALLRAAWSGEPPPALKRVNIPYPTGCAS
jgi:alcohol dehydrogenase class IV